MSNSSRAAARVRQARKKTRFDTWSCWHARSCKFFSMLWPSGHHLRSGRISAAAGKHDIDTLNLCTLTVTNHRKSSRVIFCFPKNLENIGPPWVSNPFIHWLWPGYGHFNRETDEEAKRPQVLAPRPRHWPERGGDRSGQGCATCQGWVETWQHWGGGYNMMYPLVI